MTYIMQKIPTIYFKGNHIDPVIGYRLVAGLTGT